MINFFDELKRFVKMYQNDNTDGLIFNFYGAIIPYHIAEDIYYLLVGQEEWQKEVEETIDEQRDFIRLLREENARLRGDINESD